MGFRHALGGLVFCVGVGLVASAPAAAQRVRRPLSVAQVRAQLHDVLRRYREPHDTYLALSALGTAETVPLLLERFRQDHGMARLPEPPPPPTISDPGAFPFPMIIAPVGRLVPAYVCVHEHLVDVLRNTTNTDRGMYYEDWAAWWRENRQLTQDAWIAKGFADIGLHVADPIDERYALELMGAMGGPTGYLRFNAERVLRRATAGERARWRETAAHVGAPATRLGAVRSVERIDRTGEEAFLRRLARDGDPAVAQAALTSLNARLRVTLARPAHRVTSSRHGHPTWVVDTPQGVRGGWGRTVAALDRRGPRVAWQRPGLFPADAVVATGDRVLLGSLDGDLAAMDLEGRIRWWSPGRSESDTVRRLISIGESIAVVRDTRIEMWDPVAGEIRAMIDAGGHIYDAAALGEVLFVADSRGLERIVDGRVVASRPLDKAIGVGAGWSSVCATWEKTFGCFDPNTLAPRWTAAITPDGTWGHQVAPIPYEDLVIILSGGRLAAHRADDGRVVWASDGGQYAQHFVVTPYGLFVSNDRYRPELRDLRTGEVVAAWPEPAIFNVDAIGGSGFLRAMDDSIWRVDLAEAAQGAPTGGHAPGARVRHRRSSRGKV